MDVSFGAGDAAARFAEILLNADYWNRPAQKVFAV
jgi:hypothetical protein